MTIRWLSLGMLLLGMLTFACGEDAPPIEPPSEVTQTTQNATEATTTTAATTTTTTATKDAGADVEEASAPTPAPPAVEAKPAGDDDDDATPNLASCLRQCGGDLACAGRCFI